jgi:transcriptional regulator with XRE-family HTH domain
VDYRIRIRNVREDKDYNQQQIEQLLNKSQQGYGHIEKGTTELKIDDLIILCKFYNLSADYLIGLIDTPISYKDRT